MPLVGDTLLVLSGFGVTPYSARGLTQSLEHIDQASQNRRTINGNLKDISRPEFRKYKSTIQCSDMNVPGFDGIMPGTLVQVDCVTELAYKTAGGAPSRSVVPDSSRVQGDYTFYRPRLTMRVLSYTTQDNEYAQDIGWTLELEEI